MNKIYQDYKNKASDINEHLFILKEYANLCSHVTEFGIRTGVSTVALLSGLPKEMISYDLSLKRFNLKKLPYFPVKFTAKEADVLLVNIQPTDLLFIDTYHTFSQLSVELALHADKVRKYIIMHDTVKYGIKGEDGNMPGLIRAIENFLALKTFKYRSIHHNNNGLIVLERCL